MTYPSYKKVISVDSLYNVEELFHSFDVSAADRSHFIHFPASLANLPEHFPFLLTVYVGFQYWVSDVLKFVQGSRLWQCHRSRNFGARVGSHVVAFAEVHCRERWSCTSKCCGVWWVGDLEWLFATFWMFCVEALEAVLCRSAYILVWCVVGVFGNERSAWSLLCERPLEGHDYCRDLPLVPR